VPFSANVMNQIRTFRSANKVHTKLFASECTGSHYNMLAADILCDRLSTVVKNGKYLLNASALN